MHKLKTFISFLPLLMLCGCLRTIHPLYTDADLVFEEKLVGTWSDANSKETWQYGKNGEKTYGLIYTDSNGKTGQFDVHLLKLKDQLFLDFFPADPEKEPEWNAFYSIHLIPVHTLAHVKFEGPELHMAFLDADHVQSQLEKDPSIIKHVENKDSEVFVVTASTKELQAYVLANLSKGLIRKDGYGKLKKKE